MHASMPQGHGRRRTELISQPIVSGAILSVDPLIVFTGDSADAPQSSSSLLAEPLRDREVTFFLMTAWTAEASGFADEMAAFVKKYERDYPLHRYYVFSNTPAEVATFEKRGVKAFFGHHNSLVDPRIFRPLPQTEKDLLAVYTAGLEDWKRHDLCAALASVGFLYWKYDASKDDYIRSLRATVPGARFLNEELATPPHSCLPNDKVAEILNRSRVGLCLSEAEGGMHASIEYLLAGLPVVSTPSQGGRDVFFHPDFVEIAEPTPASVAAAVDKVLARAPPPEHIRSRTIALQQKQIGSFIGLLDRLVRADGGSGYTQEYWDSRYVHKLLRSETLDDFLRPIPPLDEGRLDWRTRARRARKRVSRWVQNHFV